MKTNVNVDEESVVKLGAAFTCGVLNELCGWAACLLVLVFLFNVGRWCFGWGMDDSNKSGWERSGFTIMTDNKTGIQYLSDGKGGLVRRETK